MHRLPFICSLRSGEDWKTRNRCHFASHSGLSLICRSYNAAAVALLTEFTKASNIRDSPSVQLVVSLGKKAASAFKNETLPDSGEHIVANGFVPSDSIALID